MFLQQTFRPFQAIYEYDLKREDKFDTFSKI